MMNDIQHFKKIFEIKLNAFILWMRKMLPKGVKQLVQSYRDREKHIKDMETEFLTLSHSFGDTFSGVRFYIIYSYLIIETVIISI